MKRLPRITRQVRPARYRYAARLGPHALLDLVGHLVAALIQSDKITDPTVVDHLQSAHRLTLDLYTSSGRNHRYRPVEE